MLSHLKLGMDFPLTSLLLSGISDSGSSAVADTTFGCDLAATDIAEATSSVDERLLSFVERPFAAACGGSTC